MIRVGVLGATGYAGEELVRLLCQHPQVTIAALCSHSAAGEEFCSLYPGYRGIPGLPALCELDVSRIARDCDIAFVSLPHGASKEVVPALYQAGLKVVDFSGDFRYDDPAVYEKWYKDTHSCPELLQKSVYGLPELHRAAIQNAQLIGNPGCYTTCSILALAPAVKLGLIQPMSIIIDAKSGATGAGKGLAEQTHFCELDGSMKAYKVGTHRHTSEIEQELGKLNGAPIALSFTPHLLPIKRGILATSYATYTGKLDAAGLYAAYREFYQDEPFVTICPPGQLPELKHVVGSNRIAIGMVLDQRVGRLVLVSCIDNLIKGAAGQAVQNMNLLFGLEETMGLSMPPWIL